VEHSIKLKINRVHYHLNNRVDL